ncbi:MAG: endonuclease/exonuclease/phosphatase family protein, partial [Pyrinomonadaceae bacterium]
AACSKSITVFWSHCLLPSAFCLLLLAFLFHALAAATATPARNDPARANNPALLETGGPPKSSLPERHEVAAREPAEIKIVSYNIRWRGGEDLRRLIELLRRDAEIGGADVIGLQEVDRNRKRTGNVNTARLMADELKMHYAWAAPPPAVDDDDDDEEEEEETGVAILSRYPLSDVVRLVLPHEGPGGRRRAAVGATLHIGASRVRVYSVHAETRIKMERKMEQLAAALEDLGRRPKTKCAVVVGDLNTIKGKDVRGARKLFGDAGFTTPFPDDRSTFKAAYVIKLKLDWMWLRGLEAGESGIVRRIGLSDHWPLWLTARIGPAEENVLKTKGSDAPPARPPVGRCVEEGDILSAGTP